MEPLETKEEVAYTSHATISEEVAGLTSLKDCGRFSYLLWQIQVLC